MRTLLRDWRDGRIKMAVIVSLLQHRRTQPELYRGGDYQGLQSSGSRPDELCSYLRTFRDQVLLIAVARFPRRREEQSFNDDTAITLPPALQRMRWRDLLTGRTHEPRAERLPAAELFATLPAAVLLREAPTPGSVA